MFDTESDEGVQAAGTVEELTPTAGYKLVLKGPGLSIERDLDGGQLLSVLNLVLGGSAAPIQRMPVQPSLPPQAVQQGVSAPSGRPMMALREFLKRCWGEDDSPEGCGGCCIC